MPSSSPGSRSQSAHRAALQLVAQPLRPDRLPYVPARRLPRRPGERREPLALPPLSPALVAAVTACGLELGCAVELCLERALVIADLEEHGLAALYPRLLELAAIAEVRRALPPAKARYLQMLLAARERPPTLLEEQGVREAVIDVPMRLFPRVHDVADHPALTPRDLDEALQLEVAATSDGRVMSEWAALAALRLSL
jgi:hypothetical protein